MNSVLLLPDFNIHDTVYSNEVEPIGFASGFPVPQKRS
jgi:hypothetical protein